MFCDLNVPLGSAKQLTETLSMLAKRSFAWSYVVSGRQKGGRMLAGIGISARLINPSSSCCFLLVPVGYDGVAINQVVKGKVPQSFENEAKAPIPLLPGSTAALDVRTFALVSLVKAALLVRVRESNSQSQSPCTMA